MRGLFHGVYLALSIISTLLLFSVTDSKTEKKCRCMNYIINRRDGTIERKIEDAMVDDVGGCNDHIRTACFVKCANAMHFVYNQGGLRMYFRTGVTIGDVMCKKLNATQITSQDIGLFASVCDKPMVFLKVVSPLQLCCKGIANYICPSEYFVEMISKSMVFNNLTFYFPYQNRMRPFLV